MHRDRKLFLEALCEVVALKEAREGVAACELNEARCAQRIAPFRVVADFRFVEVENVARLIEVSLRILFNLLARKGRTGRVASGRIADRGSEVAHEEDHRVAEILKLAELVEHHRVADMNVGRRRIETELAAERRSRRLRAGELLLELGLNEEGVRAAGNGGHGFADVVRHGEAFGTLLFGRSFLCHFVFEENSVSGSEKSGGGGLSGPGNPACGGWRRLSPSSGRPPNHAQ